MDVLPQHLIDAVADGQLANGKTVSLTSLRASVKSPPIEDQVLLDIDTTLRDLERRYIVAQHVEKAGGLAYSLTAEGWWASRYSDRAYKVVTDMLALFRDWVQRGKGDFENIPWDAVKDAAKVGDADIHLYQLVSHQLQLTNGWTSSQLDKRGGRLVAEFKRPNDFDEIVNLAPDSFLATRKRQRREERVVGSKVSREAHTVISGVYRHLSGDGEWPLTKSFSAELRKIGINLVDVATANGRLIRGTNVTDPGERTHLTLRALSLLPEADADTVLLAKVIRHLAKSYEDDQETLDVPAAKLARSLESNAAEMPRLMRIMGVQGAPFTVQGKPLYPLDRSTFGTGDQMLDFLDVETIDDVVRVLNKQAQEYGGFAARPQVPSLSSEPPEFTEMPDLDEEVPLEPPATGRRGYRITPCAVVLTALELEYKAVRALLADIHEIEHHLGTVYEKGRLARDSREWDVVISHVGQGNARTAGEAMRAIEYFEPEVAMFVGIAGGVKDVKLGDVVAATSVYGYESGKEVSTKPAPNRSRKAKRKPVTPDVAAFLPRPDVGRSSYRMEQRAKAEAKKEDWKKLSTSAGDAKALVEPIVAGEKVVATDNGALVAFIKKAYSNATAVEMEGRGFLEATHANHIDAIVVRGISDLLAKKVVSDRDGWQLKAAANAAAFAMHLLSRFTPPTFAAAYPHDGLQDRERDLATLRRVLRHLPTTVMDSFLEHTQHDMVPDEIFKYWYDFDAELAAGHFHLFDRALLIPAQELHSNLRKLLSYDNFMDETSAAARPGDARFWRWRRPNLGDDHEDWSRARGEFHEAAQAAKHAYSRLLVRIKTGYREIDLLQTSAEAVQIHKDRAARRRGEPED